MTSFFVRFSFLLVRIGCLFFSPGLEQTGNHQMRKIARSIIINHHRFSKKAIRENVVFIDGSYVNRKR